MFRIFLGLIVGYFYGTKAGRKRYYQIKKGIEITTNSPLTKKALGMARRGLAKKLDPDTPRTHDIVNY